VKNVVIIAPDFTPSSYPPALRARFFAQHLREFGWNPIVLTTYPQNYEWTIDPENEKLLDPSLEIVRTSAWSIKWTRKMGFGDLAIRTLWSHWRALSRICGNRRIDLILISVPPNWQIALGRLAHMRFRIPYILDYNDPILSDYYWTLPKSKRPPKWALVHTIFRLLEPFALKKVDQVIGVDDSYLAGPFKNYKWLRGVKATPVAFGVEPADFEYVRQRPRPNPLFTPRDGLFHMSYVGRGGPDMISTLRALFTAVQRGRQKAPEAYKPLRLHFVGTTYAPNARGHYQVLPVARECGVEDIVEERPGRVQHLDAIQILLDSDALVLLGSEAPHYTASKIFPYILAAKPLVAVFHEQSSAVKLLSETGAGKAVTFSASRPPRTVLSEIEAAVGEVLALPSGWCPPTRWEKFEPFTARAVTAQLAEVFDGTLGKAELLAERTR
jgi:glycosyltransferase involved in cell wall biosynthesis